MDTTPNIEGVYNQASHQQNRINDMMSVINFCRINPTKWNDIYGDYNYRVIFNLLSAYYSEIRPKLNNKEKPKIDKAEKTIAEYLETNPIVKQVRTVSAYSSTKHSMKFDAKTWDIIRRALTQYQNLIFDSAELHKLLNPSKDNPDAEVIN